MPTAEAPAAPPPAVALPPEAVPAGAAGLMPPPAPGEPRQLVEQRVVSDEVRTRNYDDPEESTADLPFLRALPGSMAEAVAYPLTYRLAVPSGHAGVTMRQAASAPDRATQYICLPFYKPISRCVGGGG
jgi:hypothetical protein